MRSPRLAALAALVLLLVVTGCSGDDGSAAGGSSGSGGDEPGPAGSCVTSAPAGDDGLTRPGSYVCAGVPIEVPVAARSDEASQGTAEITFSGLEQAPDEVRDTLVDAGVRAEDVEGRELWFFTFEARLTGESSPGGLDGFAPFEFADGSPWTAEGDIASTLLFSDLDGCPSAAFETGSTSTIAFCRWWLVGEDDEIRGMRYAPLLVADYEPIQGAPVTWSVSETPADSFVE